MIKKNKYPDRMRLNSFVAKAMGISRRQADTLIKFGFVSVNGKTADKYNLGVKVSSLDNIKYKGIRLSLPRFQYIVLNKPRGYVTTVRDRFAKFTVMDLLPPALRYLKPVGRLDKETRGLMLLTDDGPLIHKLLHPKYNVVKEYVAKINGRLSMNQIKHIREGFVFPDFVARPCRLKIEKVTISYSLVRLFMMEGKRRQIRRMFAILDCPIIDLKRVAFGPIKLGKLKEGQIRFLKKEEIAKLNAAVTH